jgi:hypothetical protein
MELRQVYHQNRQNQNQISILFFLQLLKEVFQ